jgi:hypothetical protein
MMHKTDSDIHPVDSLIERTLARDAENTRARFAAVPNERLTTALALSTASRGLLGSLATKFALYAAGALVVGSAIYFFPSLGRQPHVLVSPAVTPTGTPAVPTLQRPSPIATIPANTQTVTRSIAPHQSHAMAAHDLAPFSHAPMLKLDEGDSKNIRHITDPKYEPPLK